jgi:hypothetical protein
MSDPAEVFSLIRASHIALLEEMRSRLSRLRASRFQARVSVNEARRLRAQNPQLPVHREEEGK